MTDLDVYVEAIVAGDPEAFGHWVAGVEASLRGSLKAFAVHVDTEAIVQETFLRVWQVAPRFRSDGRPNGLFRLAVRTAHNLAISETRRTRVDAAEQDALERALAAPDGEPRPPDPLLRRLIAECQEKLPSKPGLALAARLEAAGADSDGTLAARLSMRLNTFLQNITRARRLLAECLKKKGYDLTEAAP